MNNLKAWAVVNEIHQCSPAKAPLEPEIVIQVLSAFSEIVKAAVSKGETVHIRGLGTFYAKVHKPVKFLNPNSHARKYPPSYAYPVFRPSPSIKQKK